ncbi:MAG TPA: hypothetical protein DCL21_02530 [Alphaproteobacteria bacterium]|nr:hypothetical protein [Alphaproteobacteria bacterium]
MLETLILIFISMVVLVVFLGKCELTKIINATNESKSPEYMSEINIKAREMIKNHSNSNLDDSDTIAILNTIIISADEKMNDFKKSYFTLAFYSKSKNTSYYQTLIELKTVASTALALVSIRSVKN